MLALAESERCDVVRFVAPAVTRAQPASALVGSLCVQRAASGTCRGGRPDEVVGVLFDEAYNHDLKAAAAALSCPYMIGIDHSGSHTITG